MLGEKVGEFSGRVAGMRVLPGDDFHYVKMEFSYQLSGTLLGEAAQDMATVEVYERVPGAQTFSTGRGLIGSASGGVIYELHGVSTMNGEGMATHAVFSAAVQAPTEGPLARLNRVLLMGEQEIDAEGNITTTLYEWK
jgi:hypothetical protein